MKTLHIKEYSISNKVPRGQYSLTLKASIIVNELRTPKKAIKQDKGKHKGINKSKVMKMKIEKYQNDNPKDGSLKLKKKNKRTNFCWL